MHFSGWEMRICELFLLPFSKQEHRSELEYFVYWKTFLESVFCYYFIVASSRFEYTQNQHEQIHK